MMAAKEAVAWGFWEYRMGGKLNRKAVQLSEVDLSSAGASIEAYHAWLAENGWQIVPKKMTPQMLAAVGEVHPRSYEDGEYHDWRDQWAAALTAAPKPEEPA